MNAQREAVVQALRSQGEHDRALQVACVLPLTIDTEADAGVLSSLGIDASVLEEGS
ncbi:MAG TPA: hypothetical protein VFG72_15345 [Marmoricola sp.]|nr:hypothetical protein [Marmoricola sp.]